MGAILHFSAYAPICIFVLCSVYLVEFTFNLKSMIEICIKTLTRPKANVIVGVLTLNLAFFNKNLAFKFNGIEIHISNACSPRFVQCLYHCTMVRCTVHPHRSCTDVQCRLQCRQLIHIDIVIIVTYLQMFDQIAAGLVRSFNRDVTMFTSRCVIVIRSRAGVRDQEMFKSCRPLLSCPHEIQRIRKI